MTLSGHAMFSRLQGTYQKEQKKKKFTDQKGLWRDRACVKGVFLSRPCPKMSCVPVDKEEACANCGKHGSDNVKLKNCNACRLVKYCGVDCQRPTAGSTRGHASSVRRSSRTSSCTVRGSRGRRGTSARSAPCLYLYRCRSTQLYKFAA